MSCPCGATTSHGCGYPALPRQERPDTCLSRLRFATVDVFAGAVDETKEPLLGTAEETLLPAGGQLIVYGTGGAGKTTWSIDAVAHVAAGVPWLGHAVPRPLVVTVIENEGPRGKFRQKLGRKHEDWAGPSFVERVHVLEEPWAQFTFSDADQREQLAAHLSATSTDLLVCGPISTLGMSGGGTPDEINTFVQLVDATRGLVEQPLAVWLVHHENRAGQVSGAWERVPDTMVHLTSSGHGATRVFWQKCRWASEVHGTTQHLVWAEGAGFVAAEPTAPVTEQRVWDDLVAFVLANGGCSWNTVDAAVPGKAPRKRQVRDRMLGEGVLANLGRRRLDGTAQTFVLWHRDDPAAPPGEECVPLWDAPGDAPASHPEDRGSGAGASLRPPPKGDARRDAPAPTSSADDEGGESASQHAPPPAPVPDGPRASSSHLVRIRPKFVRDEPSLPGAETNSPPAPSPAATLSQPGAQEAVLAALAAGATPAEAAAAFGLPLAAVAALAEGTF